MKLSEFTGSKEDRAKLLGTTVEQIELSDAALALVGAAGTLIAEMRTKEGFTQAELAERIDFDGRGRISQLETGQIRHSLNLKTLAKIATALGYDLKIVATKSDNPGTPSIEIVDPKDDAGNESLS